MSAAKHVPGPWRYQLAGSDGKRVHVIYSWHNMVCTIRAGVDVGNSDLIDSICEANGRLIAAAPELLSALKNLVAMQRSGMLVRSDDAAATGHDFMTQACDAIAKAEGES